MDADEIRRALRTRNFGHLQHMELDDDMGIADDADEAPRDRCPLAEALLELVCMAEISLPKMNWIARCAIASDPSHPDLISLAELGDFVDQKLANKR